MIFPRFRTNLDLSSEETKGSKCLSCGGSLGKLPLDGTSFTYCICHQQRSVDCLRGFLIEHSINSEQQEELIVNLREELSTDKAGLIDATSRLNRQCELLTAIGCVDTGYDENFNSKKDLRRFLWAEDGFFRGFIFWSYIIKEEKRKPIIQQIFVEQGSQRTGIATKMVKKWVERVDDDNYTVLDPNPLAHAFFEGLRYEFSYEMQ